MNEKLNILIVDHALSLDEFIEHLEKIRKKTGGEVELGQIFQISKK